MKRHSPIAAIIAALATIAALIAGSSPAAANATPFRALHLNLCNSGIAECYAGGRSIPEAYEVILSTAPALVTLNEVCEEDVRTGLSTAMRKLWPTDELFWAFMPAADRRTGGAFRCRNGDRFGNGMLGRLFTSRDPYLKITGGLYPSDQQDPDDPELRSWLCVNANRLYWACSTHLRRGGGQLAMDQCHFLAKQVVSLLHAAAQLPTVVAGDLNLSYQPGSRFNAQDCVPGGWFRKGDGAVQHTMATNDFTLNGTTRMPMTNTDHPAWLVTLTKP